MRVFYDAGLYRGDKEDVAKTDGPGFIYFASVASLPAIRLVLLRPGRYNLMPGETEEDYLEISSCDVLQAFCQSDPFNDGKRRFVKIKSPIDGITRYYELKKPPPVRRPVSSQTLVGHVCVVGSAPVRAEWTELHSRHEPAEHLLAQGHVNTWCAYSSVVGG